MTKKQDRAASLRRSVLDRRTTPDDIRSALEAERSAYLEEMGDDTDDERDDY